MSNKVKSFKPGRAVILKVVILGDGGVGKSSLMNRFVSNKFDSQSFHTIGVEFLNKDLVVKEIPFTLQIWDTAGQERFKSLRTPFYRGADICMLTFGVDDLGSFKNLAMWKKEFLYYADVKKPSIFPFVVIGNKVDVGKREVYFDEAIDWCKANGDLAYIETSAKTAVNVENAFITAVEARMKIEDEMEQLLHSDIIDLSKKPSQSPCC